MPTETTWVYDNYHGSWVCQNCGIEWSFIEDGPEENGVNYCAKCGYKITKFVDEEASKTEDPTGLL